MSSKNDKYYLKLALNLAKQNEGLTSENPSVGCVIVKNNKILSLSKTSINGRPHAEVNAIRLANTKYLKGSTIYVTLEPCTHHGKTPPCTNLIIKTKIREVIYSVTDIDERVKGKSFKILKSNKIIVRKGLLKEDGSKMYWRGKYIPDNTNYFDRPWEKHARRNELKVYKTYLRTLTQTLH